jgi:hypothetical protein
MMPLSPGPPNDVSSYAPSLGIVAEALPWQFFKSESVDEVADSPLVLEQ